MRSSAFTLVEVLVYSVLFSFFACAAYGFVSAMIIWGRASGIKTKALVHHGLLLDLIRRDVMSSSCDSACWDAQAGVFCIEYIDAHEKCAQRAVCWEVCDDPYRLCTVKRSEGDYDFKKHRWKKRSVSYSMASLKQLRFVPVYAHDSRRIARILVVWEDAHHNTGQEVVVVRNRVLT